MGVKNNISNGQHHLPSMDYAERKMVEVARLQAIQKRLELAAKGNLLDPLRYYHDDVFFLMELLKGDG